MINHTGFDFGETLLVLIKGWSCFATNASILAPHCLLLGCIFQLRSPAVAASRKLHGGSSGVTAAPRAKAMRCHGGGVYLGTAKRNPNDDRWQLT